jgi:chromosome segregation ATPase
LRELAQAEERRKAEERAAKAAQIEKHLADAEAANEKLSQENEKLLAALAAQKESNKGGQQRIAELENDKAKLVSDIANLNARISQEEQAAGDIRNELIRETVEKNKIDKIRHQLEGTLRTSNAQIENIERHNAKLENLVKRQEEEINTLTSKFDEEHTELVRVSRKAQVLQEELSEAEAEILKERSAKNKIERQRSDLARKLEELDKELEHSINTQAILNDTRIRSENEINKLKQEMESVIRKHDSAFVQLRTVHEETVNEMSGRISQLIRAINKLEKEKLQLETEYGVSTRPRGQSSSRRF